MSTWNRRSVLTACAALSTAGALASVGSTTAAKTTSDSFAAGHPDGWSSYGGNAANSRYLPLEDGFPEPDTVAWRYDGTGSVAVVDGRIYVRTESDLRVLDAENGDLEWEVDIAGADGRPAVSGDGIHLGGEDYVTVFDAADGSNLWTVKFDGDDPIPEPTVAFDTVYVVADGTLHALYAADGSTRWTLDTVYARLADDPDGDPMPVSFRPETVAVANGTVYAALEGGTYSDGRELEWAFAAIDASDRDAGESWGAETEPDAWQEFVVAGETVIAHHDPHERDDVVYPTNSILGLSLEDGSVEWTLEFDGALPDVAAVDETTLYLEDDGELVAIRPSEDGSDGDEEDSNGDEDGGSDGSDGEEYEPGEDGSTDDDGGDGSGDGAADDDDGNDDPDDGDESGADESDDGAGGTDDDAGSDDGDEDDNATESDEDGDGVPGFTAGAGLLGGAATLEWLRRRAESAEPIESDAADEPTE